MGIRRGNRSITRATQDTTKNTAKDTIKNAADDTDKDTPKDTVVPAKAGIQEIPRKRAGRLPRILDSGFRRNDGFVR